MELIICNNCGKEISEQASFCPHCGTKIELEGNNYGTLTFLWEGTWTAIDSKVYLTLNGKSVGEEDYYSFKNGFSVSTPICNSVANINIKIGNTLTKDNLICTFEKGKNYVCTLSYNRFWKNFAYEITDAKGIVTFRKEYSKKPAVIFIILFLLLTFIGFYISKEYCHNFDISNFTSYQTDSDFVEQGELVVEDEICGTYKFSDEFDNAWNITINEDGTCTAVDKSGKIECYGSWTHDEFNPTLYELSFSDEAPEVYHEGDRLSTVLNFPVFDTESFFLYEDKSAWKAKNPQRRYDLSKYHDF